MEYLRVFFVVACVCVSARGEEKNAASSVLPPVPTNKADVNSARPFDSAEALRRQKETAEKLGLPVETRIALPHGAAIDFALIPAGQFVMGSPAAEKLRGNSEFPHPVRITKPFYFAKYVVTQAQWQALMPANPSLFKKNPDSDRRPVEHVSFNSITNDFLPALQKLAPPGWNVRLPTEAEWEYACRAGSTTAFFFGESITTGMANYDGTRANEGGIETFKRGETSPVGSFAPNAWGLCDMSGNVMQWCQDSYGDYYRKSPPDDPLNTEHGAGRVLRGGCWIHGPKFCRSAARYFSAPDYFAGSIGFRPVMSCP